jgi:hypothetical protein
MIKLPDEIQTAFSERCSRNTYRGHKCMFQVRDYMKYKHGTRKMFKLQTYQFSRRRLGISTKSPSERSPENLAKVVKLHM